MGMIMNAEVQPNIYKNDVIDQKQMSVDNSTMTDDDVGIYKSFTNQAAEK